MYRFEERMYVLLSHKKQKTMVLFMTALAFVLAIMMFPSKIVLAKMLPNKSTNTFSIYIDLPNGSSVLETQHVNGCVLSWLQKEKEIHTIEVFNGMGAPLDYAGLVKGSGFKQGEHLSEIVVNLVHKHTEKSYEMVHRLRPLIQHSCESLVDQTSIKMVEQPAGPPTLAGIVVELHGKSGKMREDVAQTIKRILEQTSGLVDVDILMDEVYERYTLVPDVEKITRSNLSLERVHSTLGVAFEGMAISHKNNTQGASQIPLFVTLSDASKSLKQSSKEALHEKLASLMLFNTQGVSIPLSEVVRIEAEPSTPTIVSKNLKKVVRIVAETDLVSQVYPLLEARAQIKEQFSKTFDVESTHLFDLRLRDKRSGEVFDVVWDGEMKVTLDTFRDLGGAFIAALVLIFLLMVVYYKSFALSGIVLLGSFLSIIGVIVGHWIMNGFVASTFFLTATSLIGFISLMGISSRNSLLLIDFAQTLIAQGVEKKRAIAQASATRAKPIFLTAAAIILASTLLATDPIFGGLGVALIFGTIAAVIVSLVVIPVLMDNTKAI